MDNKAQLSVAYDVKRTAITSDPFRLINFYKDVGD